VGARRLRALVPASRGHCPSSITPGASYKLLRGSIIEHPKRGLQGSHGSCSLPKARAATAALGIALVVLFAGCGSSQRGSSGRSRSRVRTSARVAIGLSAAAPAVAVRELGPVPEQIVAVLDAQGTQFTAVQGRPRVGKRAAVRVALSAAPWPGCATGISLMRTMRRSKPSAPRGLVWLVSMYSNSRVSPRGGPPHDYAGSSSHREVANYFAVVVDARHGRYVDAQDGYTRTLPRWTTVQPPHCSRP
jgi:hypothetical protein